jgi:hypothetical protein
LLFPFLYNALCRDAGYGGLTALFQTISCRSPGDVPAVATGVPEILASPQNPV